jgi:hypothetical protein
VDYLVQGENLSLEVFRWREAVLFLELVSEIERLISTLIFWVNRGCLRHYWNWTVTGILKSSMRSQKSNSAQQLIS